MGDGEYTEFKKFDPSTIKLHATILFAGGRGSGKSTVMRDFLYHLKDKVYDAKVYSGTYDEDHPWENYVPPHRVVSLADGQHFPCDALENDLRMQEERKTVAQKYGFECPPSLFIFEDLEYLKPSIWNDQSMRALMFNGRWKKTYGFFAFQYLMEVKMSMRGMFDYAVLCQENIASVRRKLHEQFGGVFPKLEQFEAAFKGLTSDHRVMVLNLRSLSYDLADCVFWYKANPNLGHFRVGAPNSWIPPTKRPKVHHTITMKPTALGSIVLKDDDTAVAAKNKNRKKQQKRRKKALFRQQKRQKTE